MLAGTRASGRWCAISDTLLGHNYLEALTFKVSQSGVQRDTERGQEQRSDDLILVKEKKSMSS
jgi:hypothetical protein